MKDNVQTSKPSATTLRPTNTPSIKLGWEQSIIRNLILYRIMECGEKISLIESADLEFIKSEIDAMMAEKYLTIDDNLEYQPTRKAREHMAALVGAYDQVLKFRLLQKIRVALNLPIQYLSRDEQGQPIDNGQVASDLFDPRFPDGPNEPAFQQDPELMTQTAQGINAFEATEDLRIAAMVWIGQCLNIDIDPYTIVFIQKLIDGELRQVGYNIWVDIRLGRVTEEIRKIAESAYQWTDLAPGNVNAASAEMNKFYSAAMAELQKRMGRRCNKCGIALATFETSKNPLTECPNKEGCGAVFMPPTPPRTETTAGSGVEYYCPNCNHKIKNRQRFCRGCSATVDWGLAEGTVVDTPIIETVSSYDTVIVEETVVFESYYGYVPVVYDPWYDPWTLPETTAIVLLTAALLW